MIDRVIRYMNKNSMLQYGEKVIVAVSGGPDSICLLHILNELKSDFGLELHAAHVNHCLRGIEADMDEEYVRRFCENNGITFHLKKINIEKYAQERNLSCETAGREARYDFFELLRRELGADKIALAHNANDQAETILMRLMRGAGIEGLRGIRPVRDGVFIRPILEITRSEIENYCKEKDLNPRIDRTNLENIYNRNKIRLELIPYIQSNFNKDIVSTLNRLAILVGRDSEFLEELAEQKFRKYCLRKDETTIDINKAAFDEKEAMTSRIIRKAISELLGDLKNIESIHIYDILELQGGSTGRRIDLPRGVSAENVYGDVHIYIRKNDSRQPQEEKAPLYLLDASELKGQDIEYENFIDEMGINIKIRMISAKEKPNFKADALTKYFDYDKIKGEICIRNRREGDRFVPHGMKGSKKLKDLFIDLKIPKDERERIPLLCFGNEIAWIIGYRVSDRFKLTKETSNILEIKIRGEKNQ